MVVSFPSSITVTFRADDRYSLSWTLIDTEEMALPKGKDAIFITAGSSILQIDVNGSLLNDPTDGSAEKQLWDDLLTLSKKSMGQKSGGNFVLATLTLQTANGSVTGVGWIRNFLADADAPDTPVEVKISFNFMFKTDPTVLLT